MNGSFVLDFITGFYQASPEEIQDRIRTNASEIERSRWEFIDLYMRQQPSIQIESMPLLEDGELCPLVTDEIYLRSDDAARNLPADRGRRFGQAGFETLLGDVRHLLLYSHRVAVADPFNNAVLEPGRAGDFLAALNLVCGLSDLVAGSVLTFVVSRAGLGGEAIRQAAFELCGKPPQAEWTALNYTEAAEILRVQRALTQVLAQGEAGKSRLTSFVPDRNDWKVIKRHLGIDNTENSEGDYLRGLIELQLPGALEIKLKDVVSIRTGDQFGAFRADLRAALRDCNDDLVGERFSAAREKVRERMAASVLMLDRKSRQGVLSKNFIPDSLGFGAGLVAAQAIGDVRAAVAGLVISALSRIAMEWPTEADLALKRHYVALSKKPSLTPPLAARSIARTNMLALFSKDETA